MRLLGNSNAGMVAGGVPKTFPQVQSVVHTEETGDTSVHDVSIPAGTTSGDLLLCFMALDASSGIVLSNMPAGWVELHSSMDATSNNLLFEIWYKIADGTETAFTYSINQSQKSENYCMRIDSWHGTTPPEVGTSVQATSTAPNPPSLTASWGSDKNLWIACFASDPGSRDVTAWPTTYPDNRREDTGPGVGGSTFGLATREYESATDDPGTFTKANSDEYTAQTIVIRP